MNQVQDIIKHIKGKHLNFAQRVVIQLRTEEGWSPYRIAKELFQYSPKRTETRNTGAVLEKAKV